MRIYKFCIQKYKIAKQVTFTHKKIENQGSMCVLPERLITGASDPEPGCKLRVILGRMNIKKGTVTNAMIL